MRNPISALLDWNDGRIMKAYLGISLNALILNILWDWVKQNENKTA